MKKGGGHFFQKKSFVFVFSVMDNIKKIASKNISVHRHSQQINTHTIKISKKRNLIKKLIFLPSTTKTSLNILEKTKKKI